MRVSGRCTASFCVRLPRASCRTRQDKFSIVFCARRDASWTKSSTQPALFAATFLADRKCTDEDDDRRRRRVADDCTNLFRADDLSRKVKRNLLCCKCITRGQTRPNLILVCGCGNFESRRCAAAKCQAAPDDPLQ